MKYAWKIGFVVSLITAQAGFGVASSSLAQYGIVWDFDRDYPTGQYANGDYWVIGPVNITSISNNHHTNGLSPVVGMDGCMINPGGCSRQGYDNRLDNYQSSLNCSYPNGGAISSTNPLLLDINSSLISAVSWIDGEPGCPGVNDGTGTPRPAVRTMAILTCVSNTPPVGSFRPPYCGSNKTARFNISQLRFDKLANLAPVSNTPALAAVEANFAGPWVDHVYDYPGAYIHPEMHIPQYGQELSFRIGEAALMLQLDFSRLPSSPTKDLLLMRVVQVGIDLAGIADAGGGWPSNGGIGMGRKWPILFAGLMLDDEHMKNAGHWDTRFQEDDDTFYVSQAEIDLTHSAAWKPDPRAGELLSYDTEHVGLPEWGVRHTDKPTVDNRSWAASYREVNYSAYPGWVLAAHIMGQRVAWNHAPLFDYIDRSTSIVNPFYTSDSQIASNVYGGYFIRNMWRAYRANYPPQWVPDNPANVYGSGHLDCSGDGLVFSITAQSL